MLVGIVSMVLAAALAGCAPEAVGIQSETATAFQQRVLMVSEAVASEDTAGALSEVDALEADLAYAAQNAQISDDRRRRIATALAAVRADLRQAVEAAQARAALDAEAAAAATALAAAETAKAEEVAAESATVVQQPAPILPAPDPQPAKRSNPGKAKGKNG